MRNTILKAATLIVAIAFVVGATIAAGGAPSKNNTAKPAEVKADAGSSKPKFLPATKAGPALELEDAPAPTPEAKPTFLPPTKAALPMHFEEKPSPAQAQQAPPQAAQPTAAPKPATKKPAPAQAGPTQQATP